MLDLSVLIFKLYSEAFPFGIDSAEVWRYESPRVHTRGHEFDSQCSQDFFQESRRRKT